MYLYIAMEIIDYPNYLIYDDGRVWSKTTKKFKNASTYQTTGYKYIALWKDNKNKLFLIHRLIAIHYIPNPNNLPQVNHINCVRTDNTIDNLEWVTNMENSQSKNTTRNIGSVYLVNKRYVSEITINCKRYCKSFKTEAEGRAWCLNMSNSKQ